MRYRYNNVAYRRSGAAHGFECDPVKRYGKCIIGRGSQVVRFSDGVIAVVIRRCLRLQIGAV